MTSFICVLSEARYAVPLATALRSSSADTARSTAAPRIVMKAGPSSTVTFSGASGSSRPLKFA